MSIILAQTPQYLQILELLFGGKKYRYFIRNAIKISKMQIQVFQRVAVHFSNSTTKLPEDTCGLTGYSEQENDV